MSNGDDALKIAKLAHQILPTPENKCACALAARNATHAIDSFMQVVNVSPGFLIYQPHRDEELGEIDEYIKRTDELCQLGGILSELFNVSDMVKKEIDKNAIWDQNIQRVLEDEDIPMSEVNQMPAIQDMAREIDNFMLNKVSGRFRDLLKGCEVKK